MPDILYKVKRLYEFFSSAILWAPDRLGHIKPEMTRRCAKRAATVLADTVESRRKNLIKTEAANS